MNTLHRLNLGIFNQLAIVILIALSSNLALGDDSDIRLVSIDGSITEIVYKLEAEHVLVGVDTTSLYPLAAQTLPNVGYMRNLNLEGILSLSPTHVIATQSAKPDHVFDKLSQAGVIVHRIKNDYSLNGLLHKINAVASIVHKPQKGKQITAAIERNINSALSVINSRNINSKNVLFLLSAGSRGLMAAGKNTQAQALLTMLGVNNVMKHPGYKPISQEGLLSTQPEIILIAQTQTTSDTHAQHYFKHTPAYKNSSIHYLDTSLVLGFGPRLEEAVNLLIPIVYEKPALARH